MANVYLWKTDVDSIDPEELAGKLEPFLEDFSKNRRIALKMHFGEKKKQHTPKT